ncbi:MAG: hypothetical protein CMB67_02525 [Euryarchaeota archaeon]|nr:hypothetical protein [Euryarchaeota archaeon]
MGRLGAQRGKTMSGGAFCITCGSEPPLSSDRLCESCLRQRTVLSKMPETIQQRRCAKCNSIEIRGGWSKLDSEGIADSRIRENLVLEERASKIEVSFSVQEIDERTSRLHVVVSGTIEGHKFEDSHSPLLQTSNAVCTPCTRKDGDYFEATVQLRSAGRKLNDKELSRLRATLDDMIESMEPNPMFFISKEGPVQGGWDLQLGSKSLARTWGRRLTKSFGGTVKESSKVIGVSDGAEVSRLTLSYRKPAYAIGDVIRHKKDLWLVDSWQKEGPIIRRLDRFERTGATWRDMESSSVICSHSDQINVQILNRDTSAAEILDPSDFKVTTVALPYDDDGSSEELRIAFIDGEWVALPV